MSGLGRHFRLVEEARLPLGFDVLEELFVLLCLLAVGVAFLLGEGAAGACHEVGHIGVVTDADVASVGRDVGHPVAMNRVGAVVLVAAACLGGEELHVALVGFEVVAQNVLVARHHIDVPGNDDACFAPSRRCVFHAPMIGSDDGVGAVGTLGGAHIAHPFLIEVAGVAIVEACHRIDLRVGCPAHALVALRAVGGHADEVGTLSPHDVAVELVDVGVAGAERRLLLDGARHGLADDVGQFDVGRSGHFDVAEAEVGCRGMEAFAFSSTLEGIVERGFGGTKVLCVDGTCRPVVATAAVAGGVRHLAEAETKLRSRLTLRGEADPAGCVLTQVDNGGLAGFECEVVLLLQFRKHVYLAEGLAVGFRALIYLYGLGVTTQAFYGHDGRSFEGTNLAFEVVRHGYTEPIAVVEVGRELSCFESGIVGLAVIDVAFAQRTVGIATPGEVGGDGDDGAVLQFHLEQSAEGIGLVAVYAVHDAAVPPAGRHLGADGVLAFAQQSRHVVRGVEDGLQHLGCSRFELVVECLAVLVGLTHAFAVDEDVVDAQAGCVETCTTDCRSELKGLTEHRHACHHAAVLLHESLAAAHGCLHVALATAAVVAYVGGVEGIACTLEVLAEGDSGVAVFVINGLRDVVEVCSFTLVAGCTDAHAEVADGQHALCVLIGIDEHIIYICTDVWRLALEGDVVLLADDVGLREGGDGRIVVGEVAVQIDVAANYWLVDVEGIDGPHHVGAAGGGAEADAGVVVDEGEVEIHVEADGLGYLLLPSVCGGTAHVELSALQRAALEHAAVAVEVLLEERLSGGCHLEVVEQGLLGLVAVVVVLAEAEVAVSEVARAGIDKYIIYICTRDVAAGDAHLEGMLLAVLDADARDGRFGEESRVAAAPAMRTETEAAVGIDLPHIVVAVVGSSEDEAGSELLHRELHFHFVVRRRFVLPSFRRAGGGLDPLRVAPSISPHQACLEVSLLGARCGLALVVRYGDAPVVACLGSRHEALGLHEHAFVGVDTSRLPHHIAESGIGGYLQAVACLHHASLLALELPGEVNGTAVDADGIAIIFCTKVDDVECEGRNCQQQRHDRK